MFSNVFFKCHIGHFINQYCKLVFRKDQHIGNILANSRTCTYRTCLHPQCGKHFLELSAKSNGSLIKKTKFKEHCICLKAICHRLVISKIIAFKGISFYIVSFDAAYSTRPCNIAGNAEFFPFFITGIIATV